MSNVFFVIHTARRWVGRACPISLCTLVILVVVSPSSGSAQQLNLSWVDNSGGQAGFIVQRAPSATEPYAQIAQVPPGVVSYIDTSVALGATYCYRVAAVNDAIALAQGNLDYLRSRGPEFGTRCSWVCSAPSSPL
jgi:hypothetical protein